MTKYLQIIVFILRSQYSNRRFFPFLFHKIYSLMKIVYIITSILTLSSGQLIFNPTSVQSPTATKSTSRFPTLNLDLLKNLRSEMFIRGDNYIRGIENNVQGAGNVALGNLNDLYGANNYVQGVKNTIKGIGNIAIGESQKITGALNTGLGTENNVEGNKNWAEGLSNIIKGDENKATGLNNVIIGKINQVQGRENVVTGTENILQGAKNTADGHFNILSGLQNKVTGQSNAVKGENNNLVGNNNVAVGKQNRVTGGNNRIEGQSNGVAGGSNQIKGESNMLLGSESLVVGSQNAVAGNENKISGIGNAVDGSQNLVDGGSNALVGDRNEVFGEKNIVTSIVDVSELPGMEYLQKYLNNPTLAAQFLANLPRAQSQAIQLRADQAHQIQSTYLSQPQLHQHAPTKFQPEDFPTLTSATLADPVQNSRTMSSSTEHRLQLQNIPVQISRVAALDNQTMPKSNVLSSSIPNSAPPSPPTQNPNNYVFQLQPLPEKTL